MLLTAVQLAVVERKEEVLVALLLGTTEIQLFNAINAKIVVIEKVALCLSFFFYGALFISFYIFQSLSITSIFYLFTSSSPCVPNIRQTACRMQMGIGQ